MAPLEQHALRTLQRLRGTAAFVRDLQSVEDKCALEYAKLPRIVADTGYTGLKHAPELARMCSAFDALMRTQSDAKAQLAQDLAHSVVLPVDKFADQQSKQLRRLLLEVAQALEREQALQTQLCTRAREHCRLVATAEDPPGAAHERRQQLRALGAQRTNERCIVRTRLDELHLAEQQQRAVVSHVLERLVAIYRRMLAQTSTVATELQAKLVAWQTETHPTALAGPTPEPPEHESDGAWTLFLKTCERHVEMTEWMNSVFTQLVAVEDAMVKRLQALRKLHPAVEGFDCTTDAAAAGGARRDGAAPPVLTAWMHFHTLLTVNLRDPISRTLTFSAHKQRRIRKELLESLDETTKLVQRSRKSVTERTLQHRKLVRAGASCDASSSRLLAEGAAGSLSSHVADAMKLHLSTFGLRSAVVATLSMSSSHRALPYASVVVESGTDTETSGSSATSGEHKQAIGPASVDKELLDARTYLQSLERNEAEQRRDIRTTLRSTSLLSVKTMELMVGDYLKHVCKALAALDEQLHAFDATRAASSTASLQPHKWLDAAVFASDDPIVLDLMRALERPSATQLHESAGAANRSLDVDARLDVVAVPRRQLARARHARALASAQCRVRERALASRHVCARRCCDCCARSARDGVRVASPHASERALGRPRCAPARRHRRLGAAALAPAAHSMTKAVSPVKRRLRYGTSQARRSEARRPARSAQRAPLKMIPLSSVRTACESRAALLPQWVHRALRRRGPQLCRAPARQSVQQQQRHRSHATVTSLCRKRSAREWCDADEQQQRACCDRSAGVRVRKRPRLDRLRPWSLHASHASATAAKRTRWSARSWRWCRAQLCTALEHALQQLLASVVSCITCAAVVWLVRTSHPHALGVRLDVGAFSVEL